MRELTELVTRSPDLFVRYSRGPDHDAGESSRDYEAEVDMPGLSVTTISPEPWWTRPAEDWIARRVCQYNDLRRDSSDERRPWLLRGRVVGAGPDHEPLVVDVVPVAWIGESAIAEAKRRYQERFHVGRDSTDD
ncbi:hypothetical protein D5H75_34065 [Bailinhaonella thermotolerans]|uniref:Uncharacterized protein n=1 Tax=Bailinhaonella thermotolerans TaxID=1070861 RepID=A0A3A4A7X2_9ACTN|nr:hypothetical protein D5H75_34065 [Bailinhaonella thermotolerans]